MIYTQEELSKMERACNTYGSNWDTKLWELMCVSDSINQARLIQAFPEIFEKLKMFADKMEERK